MGLYSPFLQTKFYTKKEGGGEGIKKTKKMGINIFTFLQNTSYTPHVFQLPCVYAFSELVGPFLRTMKNISYPHGFQITWNPVDKHEELWYKEFASDAGYFSLLFF